MNKEQQELFLKLSTYEQQMQQLQQQLQAVEQAVNDLKSLNLGLDDLVGKKDREIFAPIGRGIFAKAKLISEDLNVDVGGKNFVRKTIPETKQLLENQIKKLEGIKKELNDNMENLSEEFAQILEDVQRGEKREGK